MIWTKRTFNFILTLVMMLTMTQTAWAECDYFVYYTYGSKNYYLEQGDQVVNVSTVLQRLQLYGVCTDVQTFDNSCVAVTAIDNDWTLQVKKVFETKVINCTVDGQAYEIRVTSLPTTISVVLKSTLFFDKSGGTGEYKITSGKDEYTDRVLIRVNSMYELPECPYTAPEGYTFAGWELNGKIYQENELYFFTGKTTAKALWKDANEVIINRAPEHNISIASGLEHGSIGVQVTAREGEIVPVTMLPADGYMAQSVSINGSPITLPSSTTTAIRPDGNYTFTMPSGDVTISADFVKSLAGGTESVPVSLNDPDVYFLTGGWYVVDNNITFTHYIILAGDVHLVLADGFTMNLGTKSQMLTSEKKPILGRLSKDFDYGLTIHGGTEGTGALNAYYNYSNITGNCINVKDFTFEGGKMHIETKGIEYAVFVGNDVTINGGDITLIRNNYRGGITSQSGDVRVTGGTINGYITTKGDIYMSDGTIRGIYTENENAYITGGKITEGANARRKLSLNFTGENDLFYVDQRWTYPYIFIIEPGVVMTDGTTNYSGILSNDDVAALTGKTLRYQPGTYYTVHYNTNANTNDGDVIRYEVPDQSILGTGKLSRGTYLSQKGHKFSGWNTAADGSGTPYADMAMVTLTADLELYAQWDKYDNTVTWKNGDTTLETDEAVAYGTMPSYDGDVPTKASDEEYNYVFTGWYPTPGIVTTNVTYSAMFTPMPKAQSLADNADNNTTINTLATDGGTWNVTLAGRTLYKDGKWNTLCLPFALSTAEIEANDKLSGCTLMTMAVAQKNGFDTENGTLYLWFKPATEIEAGVPYLVKWEKAADYEGNEASYDIVDPMFENVNVSSTTAQTVESTTAGLEMVQMVGTFSPFSMTADDKSILFLGDANTLYHSGTDRQIHSCRVYFSVPYIKEHAGAQARAFALNFDGEEATGISLTPNPLAKGEVSDYWYAIDGRKLSRKPTQRGIYINKDKKILVK